MLISIDLFPLNNFHFKSHQHERAASALACKCKTNARWKMQFFICIIYFSLTLLLNKYTLWSLAPPPLDWHTDTLKPVAHGTTLRATLTSWTCPDTLHYSTEFSNAFMPAQHKHVYHWDQTFSEICPILHVEQQHDTWIHKIIWLDWNNLSRNTARQKIHIALSLNIQQGILWCKQIHLWNVIAMDLKIQKH